MNRKTIQEALGNNRYPGRGILIGKSADSRHAVMAYFIMGRSANSRNRVFAEDGAGLRTEPADPALVEDPSLIIYAPVRTVGSFTIVTNGDQTDTIYEHLAAGGDFAGALRTRAFEPDAPNFTPRISGVVQRRDRDFSFALSILKADDEQNCLRYFYEYEAPLAGEGRLIHTYFGDGTPLPSFEGEPTAVSISGDLNAFTEELWSALDAENKIALFVRYLDLANGSFQTNLRNRYHKK